MQRVRHDIPEPRIEIIPLLDVVFLLLTFFIFAIVVMVRIDTTSITLPEASDAPAVAPGPAMTISLDADANLFIDAAPTTLESLREELPELLETIPDARLFIAADERAPAGSLFRLMDTLQSLGVSNLQFLRDPAEGEAGGQ